MLRPTDDDHRRQQSLGLIYGIAAYGTWGLAPIYFKAVKHVPAQLVLAHRIAWSVLLVLIILAMKNRWREVIECVRNRRTLLLLVASTIAVAVNWYVYIWSVGHDRVITASLGYFINPLVNVLLGVLILRERLRPGQTIAVILAASAVMSLMIAERQVPTIPLVIATSFGLYGLLRKQAVVAPIIGLFVETAILLPFSLVFITAEGSIFHTDARTFGLLALSGVITAIPLIWFSAAARRLRLTTMGFLQYLSPTGQFLLGLFAYHEPLDHRRLICFVGVWIALGIFAIDSMTAARVAVAPPD